LGAEFGGKEVTREVQFRVQARERRIMNVKGSGLAVSAVIVVVVAALTLLVVTGFLTPQRFALAGLGVMVVGAIAWSILLKRSRGGSDEIDTNADGKVQGGERPKYILVTLLLLWLVATFWMTRGGPWGPRLVGAAVLVLVLVGVILRRTTQVK
jgi:hypothetical protein